MRAVENFLSGRYWCGAVIGAYIFISAHVRDHLEEGGRAEIVFKDMLNYVHATQTSFPDVCLEITIGVDANIGFPAQ